MFKDAYANPTVGFCLWCAENFYSIEDVEKLNTNVWRLARNFKMSSGGVDLSTVRTRPIGFLCFAFV
jgi:hypothetical protein